MLPSIEVRLVSVAQPSREAARRVLYSRLAERLGCSVEELQIVREPLHKPRLAGLPLHFSFSYRAPWCAFAISEELETGVDVEPVRDIPEMHGIVRQFFPPVAREGFLRASPEQQQDVFFRWWTRIEAAVKATGLGLDASRSCFEGVVYGSCERVPGVSLAAAAVSREPVEVEWLVPGQPAIRSVLVNRK